MVARGRIKAPKYLGVFKSVNPPGVPADLKSAVKKGSTYKHRGICNPPIKGKAYPLLRIANPQSLNRLGHFLTPDFKSGGTPSGLVVKSGEEW